ncbi:MAG: Glutathione-specific gamma-glutamylcyclotransferase [Chroococcidiopsis cubana SAG 39.79]|uniref:glutathione-specific gamma-glutamylcyclotransferase n=1 Tax=Chroococcidiopsis cubana SAG 39.79 TaxID=388085 RepID=A0AB37U7Z2_9CYAN|nr:gamma-glutamylcyclotransferase [Chroococcidiopsis cubana]MDZ4872181.1 Glutathione-specific gamma-glutamylcyclotransferase [Chroococcidiopsis cubana SAG 39.79]PSB59853.1 gamma-glutamylcyclotransferase [Chroococcidiopsis cubana CCALA 043]RUS96285.1 gamma-glutamylcyclotransferase [Chroococcidiopsis cubana SAG 39.79]
MSLTRADLKTGRLQAMVLQSSELTPYLLSEAQLQASITTTLQAHPPNTDLWIFAYGSLIWSPCFKFVEARVVKLSGWHRRFCLSAPVGRGTPENPGLILGLDCGESCCGVAYRIAASDVAAELQLLWQREMVVGAYIPQWVKVFSGEQAVEAIAFVINQQHPLYTGSLSLEMTIESLATASGQLGSCADYFLQTIDGLATVGIKDETLLFLRDRVIARQQSLFDAANLSDASH